MSSLRLQRLFHFGKGRQFLLDGPVAAAASTTLADDLKLFAGTFAAGFLFVAIYLG